MKLNHFFFLSILLWISTTFSVLAQNIKSDTVGQITNKMIRCGDTLRISCVSATLGDSSKGTRFSVSDAAPITPVNKPSINPLTGLLVFICDSADTDPFTIEITATNGLQTDRQTIEITPLPYLPTEVTTFGLLPNSEWDPVNPKNQIIAYQSGKTTTKIEKTLAFNANDRDTVSEGLIVGREVIFEKGSEFYERYSMGGKRYDLKKLTIAAEKVIFRDTIIFHGTDVRIQAKEIRFEDKGIDNRAVLITTPINFWSSANATQRDVALPDTAKRGEAGMNGTKGGDIDISAKYLIARGGLPRFIINGSNGQSTARSQKQSIDPPAGRGGDGGTFKSSGCKDTHNQAINFSTLVKNDAGFNGFRGTIRDTIGKPENGKVTILSDDAWSWFNPYILRLKLSFTKDCYRERYIEYAYQQAGEIRTALTELPKPISDDLPVEQKQEIQNLTEECDALQYRIANNMDYYGFPAGWVPMISLNTSISIYRNEIDYAMNALFLSTWINGIADSLNARIDGIKAVRESIIDQVGGYQQQYSTANSALGTLYDESDKTKKETDATQTAFAERQRQLQEQAKSIVADRYKPKKQSKWQRIAKIAGTIAQFSPILQPAAGLVGQGLIIASEYDKNDKWATIEKFKGLAGQFQELGGLNGVLQKTNNNFSDVVKAFNPAQFSRDVKNAKTKDDYTKLAKAVQDYYRKQATEFGITDSIAKIKSILRLAKEQTQIPSDEVGVEISRLLAEDPAYNSLMTRLAELQVKTEHITREISENTEATFSNYNKINSAINAVDALNRNLDAGLAAIDQRVIAYTKDLERDAYDRMNKYHYYIAKAYEYQFLKPYGRTMERDKIIEKIKEFAKSASSSGRLTTENLSSLRSVYEEILSKLSQEINDNAAIGNTVATGRVYSNTWIVPSSVVKKLQQNEPVILNLSTMQDARGESLFQGDWENVRIDSIAFQYIKLSKSTNKPVTLQIQHSGISEKVYRGKRYLFRHYVNPAAIGANEKTSLEWSGTLQPNSTSPQYSTTFNDEFISLLKSISQVNVSEKHMFVKPSATSDLVLQKSEDFPSDIEVDSIVLSVALRYTPVAIDPNVRKLKVSMNNQFIQPLIKLSKSEDNPWIEDNKFRKHGRGQFTRSYAKNDKITITAPPSFGYWSFNRWIEKDANGNQVRTSGKLEDQITLEENKNLVAEYQIPYSLGVDGIVPVGTNGQKKSFVTPKDTLVLTIPAQLDKSVVIDKRDTSESKIFLEQNAQWGWETQDSALTSHVGYELQNNVLIINNPKEDDTVTVYAYIDYGGAQHYLNRSFVLHNGVVSVKEEQQAVPGYPNPLQVFPNPANEICTIHYKPLALGYTSISLYSVNGREVLSIYRGHISQNEFTTTVALKELPNGNYILRCSTPNASYSSNISIIR